MHRDDTGDGRPTTSGGGAPVPRSIASAAANLARSFAAAGIDSALTDARLLLARATGLDTAALVSRPERLLTPEEERALAHMAARRLAREPVTRILGRRGFYGLDLAISAATLDPRPETETIVDAVLAWVRQQDRPGWRPTILDLGTGSGAILLALLANMPAAMGLGVDVGADALRIAGANADSHALADRARFQVSDWLDDVTGTFDIVVSNPPYIADSVIVTLEPEVARYDPRSALSGGPDGLHAYRRIIANLEGTLATPGLAVFEIGHDQGDAVVDLLRQSLPRLRSVEVQADLAGQPRCVLATT